MKTDNLTKIAGLSLAALLALTACGDGDNGGNGDADDANGGDEQAEGEEGEAGGETFAFENTSAGPYDEVTVTVPDEYDDTEALRVATGESDGEQAITDDYTYAESEVIESITLRAAEPEEAQCAIEAEYTFNHDTIGEEPVHQIATSLDGMDFHDLDSLMQWHNLDEDQIVAHDDDYAIWEWEQTDLFSSLIGRSDTDLSVEEDEEQFLETHTLVEEVDCNSPVTLAFTVVDGVQEETGVTVVEEGGEPEHGEEIESEETTYLEGETWTRTWTDEVGTFATFDVAVDAESGELSIQNAQVDADD